MARALAVVLALALLAVGWSFSRTACAARPAADDAADDRARPADSARGRRHAAEIEAFRRRLAAAPDDADAWLRYGNLLQREVGDHAGAAAAYLRVTELRPELSEAHYTLGLALLELERYEDAAASFESALGLAPPDAAWRTRAEELLAQAYALAASAR